MKRLKGILALIVAACMVLSIFSAFAISALAVGAGDSLTVSVSLHNEANVPSDSWGIECQFMDSTGALIGEKIELMSFPPSSGTSLTDTKAVPKNASKIKINRMFLGDGNKAMYNGSKINIEDEISLDTVTDGKVDILIEKDDSQQGPPEDPPAGPPAGEPQREEWSKTDDIHATFTFYDEKNEETNNIINDSEIRFFKVNPEDGKDSSINLIVSFQAPYGNTIKKVVINNNVITSEGIAEEDPSRFFYYMEKPKNGELDIKVYYDIDSNINPTIVWVYSEETARENDFADPRGEVDCLVEHGKVKILSVSLPDGVETVDHKTALYYDDLTGLVEVDRGQGMGLFHKYEEAWYDDGGDNINDGFGYASIKADSIVTIEIVPDYGYQVVGAELNGAPLTPQARVSTFTFKMPQTPLHLSALFTSSNDTINDHSDVVSNVSVENGENAAKSGNLSLTVNDVSPNEDEISRAVSEVEGNNVSFVSAVDMSLDNIVSKGSPGSYWTTNLTEFTSEVTVSLALPNPETGYTYDVVRDHEGVLTDLDVSYSNGVLSVPTNKFSTYTIVKKKVSQGNNNYIYSPIISSPTTNSSSATIGGGSGSSKISVSVDSGNAVISEISTQAINAAINTSANAGKNDTSLVIDVSGKGKDGKEITKVTFTKNTMKNVSKALESTTNNKTDLVVETGTATITMDTIAVAAMVEKAGGESIQFVIENTVSSTLNDNQKNAINSLKMGAEKSVAQTFSAYVTSGNEKITNFNGGFVTVAVTNFKIPSGKKSEYYHVYSIPEAGEPAKCATWVENGVIYFRL